MQSFSPVVTPDSDHSTFGAMFENHRAVMLLIEPETGRLVAANPAAAHFYGYSQTQLETMNIADINLLSPEVLLSERREVVLAGKSYFVFPHRLADGQVRTVEVYSSAVEIDGRPLLFSIIHDITERQWAAEALQRSETRYRTLVQQITDGIIIVDSFGLIRFANPAATVLFGRPDADLTGSPFGFPLAAGSIAELDIVRPDGNAAVAELRAAEIEGPNGPDYLVSLRDITMRKQAEAALQESEERFRILVDSMDDVIFTLDRQQRHTAVYGRWVEKQGLTPQMFLGKTALEIMGPEAAAVHIAANEQALAGEHVVYDWSVGSGAETQHYQTLLSPIHGSRGEVVGLVGVGRDITDRKRVEAEREQLIAELTEALAQVKQLSSLLPICASCKKIRDDRGYWQEVEVYIRQHAGVEFSHGICPDCKEKLYPREVYPYLYSQV